MIPFIASSIQKRILTNDSIKIQESISHKEIERAFKILLKLNFNLQKQIPLLKEWLNNIQISWFTYHNDCILPSRVEDKIDALRFKKSIINDEWKKREILKLQQKEADTYVLSLNWNIQEKANTILFILNDLFINANALSFFNNQQLKKRKIDDWANRDIFNLPKDIYQIVFAECYRNTMSQHLYNMNFLSQNSKIYHWNHSLTLKNSLLKQFNEISFFH